MKKIFLSTALIIAFIGTAHAGKIKLENRTGHNLHVVLEPDRQSEAFRVDAGNNEEFAVENDIYDAIDIDGFEYTKSVGCTKLNMHVTDYSHYVITLSEKYLQNKTINLYCRVKDMSSPRQ